MDCKKLMEKYIIPPILDLNKLFKDMITDK